MRDLSLVLFVFALLPYILVRPHIGLLTWSWLGYMNPHRFTWGFAYNFPFVQLVGITTLVAIPFSKEKKTIPVTGLTVVWALLVLWMCFTTLFATNPVFAHAELSRTIKIQIMVLVTLLTINTRVRIDQLIWVIAVSIGFFGVKGGIFTILTGGQYIVWGPPGSFIEGNNEVAFAMLIIFPFLHYLYTQAARRWLRWGLAVCMLLTGVAIVGSYSRGALLGAGAMLFALWLRTKRKMVTGIVLALAAAAVVVFAPAQWSDRIATIETYQQDESAMGRINAWHFAWNLALDRPLVGGGFQTFTRELFRRYAPEPENFHDAHSIYFEMLAEQGFVGLGLFLTLGILAMRQCSRTRKYCTGKSELEWARNLAGALQVSLIGYATGGAFLGLAYFDLPYQIMAIVALLEHLVRTRVAAEEEQYAGVTRHFAGLPLGSTR
jgi:probable O-glycosylation ligase (exosortase A-associated)